MAKARPIPDLRMDDPYALAASKVVSVRAAELFALSADVLDLGDIERVHDMRVASRRLRAALEIFAPCFPRREFKRTLREVKALADALGERRDRDVTIDALRGFAAAIGQPDRPGVLSLIARIRDEQREANEALAPFVFEERLGKLARRLERLVVSAGELAPEGSSR